MVSIEKEFSPDVTCEGICTEEVTNIEKEYFFSLSIINKLLLT